MQNRPIIQSSKWNHGDEPNIVCTVTTEQEIRFFAEDIVKMLRTFGSNDIAKIFNEMGKQFHESDLCACVEELDNQGTEMIDNLKYFIDEHYKRLD